MDRLWGIGLSSSDPRAMNRDQWPGKNWLGQILTEVRDEMLSANEKALFSGGGGLKREKEVKKFKGAEMEDSEESERKKRREERTENNTKGSSE